MRSTTAARIVAALAVTAGAAAPTLPGAEAATRTCLLLQDETGDAGLGGGEGGLGAAPGTDEPSVDVVSADIATDATRLTVVIRVSKLEYGEAPLPVGGSWSFHFATPEGAFFLRAGRTYVGDSFELARYTSDYVGDSSQSYTWEPVGPVSGVVDQARSEIRMTAPLSMFAAHDRITPGTTLTKLLVMTWFQQSASSELLDLGTQADETPSGRSPKYVAGAKSCVKVGA